MLQTLSPRTKRILQIFLAFLALVVFVAAFILVRKEIALGGYHLIPLDGTVTKVGSHWYQAKIEKDGGKKRIRIYRSTSEKKKGDVVYDANPDKVTGDYAATNDTYIYLVRADLKRTKYTLRRITIGSDETSAEMKATPQAMTICFARDNFIYYNRWDEAESNVYAFSASAEKATKIKKNAYVLGSEDPCLLMMNLASDANIYPLRIFDLSFDKTIKKIKYNDKGFLLEDWQITNHDLYTVSRKPADTPGGTEWVRVCQYFFSGASTKTSLELEGYDAEIGAIVPGFIYYRYRETADGPFLYGKSAITSGRRETIKETDFLAAPSHDDVPVIAPQPPEDVPDEEEETDTYEEQSDDMS